ncbi:hypothetical protein [Otariodibacter oris]|uniref:Uncharacterized protein n=1 Tax=Otariodibacter oris TaxID=1032623 RepID=A0A420XF20_9PAST|nr:hypothetical protein [Otariodibacter oris]QGM81481.1 hypothetical protein A6A10_08705 [Otariodibacter oris]RKR71084.1 hypothetical protein DES31_1661 [Otariodibacter oris]
MANKTFTISQIDLDILFHRQEEAEAIVFLLQRWKEDSEDLTEKRALTVLEGCLLKIYTELKRIEGAENGK